MHKWPISELRHGYGILKWSNGDRFEGNWKDNKTFGRGTLFTISGDVLEGDWVND